MKKIKPAKDDFQVVSGNLEPGFGNLARARKALFAAIRETILEAMSISSPKQIEVLTNPPESFLVLTKEQKAYLDKFDKMMNSCQ